MKTVKIGVSRSCVRCGVFAAALAVAFLSQAADVPWKFEGDTNRVAAASQASAVWSGFVAHEVSIRETGVWEDLVRNESTFYYSPLTRILSQFGLLLILR